MSGKTQRLDDLTNCSLHMHSYEWVDMNEWAAAEWALLLEGEAHRTLISHAVVDRLVEPEREVPSVLQTVAE